MANVILSCVKYLLLQSVFTPHRLTSYYLELEVLLGQLLPPQRTSSCSAEAATATGRHLFAEGAYDLVMQMMDSYKCSTAPTDIITQSSSSSSGLQWGSSGSVQLLHLAAVWHAIMRARARSYESYQDR